MPYHRLARMPYRTLYTASPRVREYFLARASQPTKCNTYRLLPQHAHGHVSAALHSQACGGSEAATPPGTQGHSTHLAPPSRPRARSRARHIVLGTTGLCHRTTLDWSRCPSRYLPGRFHHLGRLATAHGWPITIGSPARVARVGILCDSGKVRDTPWGCPLLCVQEEYTLVLGQSKPQEQPIYLVQRKFFHPLRAGPMLALRARARSNYYHRHCLSSWMSGPGAGSTLFSSSMNSSGSSVGLVTGP